MPNRPIRRSQAIAPFGPGALVDFPGPVSLIHCGIDAWPFDKNNKNHHEFMIEDEPRLANRLGVEFFVLPPDFRRQDYKRKNSEIVNEGLYLPFLRFPRWHVCPRCGLMYESALHDSVSPKCTGPLGTGSQKGKRHNARNTVQVRFVAACENGHLQDFPWWEWLFRTANPDKDGRRLRMISAGSSSLAGVRVVCEKDLDHEVTVIKNSTLSGAFNFEMGEESPFSDIGLTCVGENPALGIPSSTYQARGCGLNLYPLLRGSSNAYFPHVKSSIFLPARDQLANDDAMGILEDEDVWSLVARLAKHTGGEIQESQLMDVVTDFYPDREVDIRDLVVLANRRLRGETSGSFVSIVTDEPEVAFRRQEYDLLSRDVSDGYSKKNLLVRSADLNKFEPEISAFFSRICLVHKLRETRAFVGFSRIHPPRESEIASAKALISRDSMDWLPAIVVRGEGIFLQFKESRIKQWLADWGNYLELRTSKLGRSWFDESNGDSHDISNPVTPRFVLLHTLSHILINQLVFECGYSSASLRERIYCSDGDHPMAGILVYTAAGDSEGSMGGLVRMGSPGRFERTLKRALLKAQWCSSDPVCIESLGQGPDNCNLAACHSCALVPETTCEEQNRLLDRGVLVGTLDQPSSGFFEYLLSNVHQTLDGDQSDWD